MRQQTEPGGEREEELSRQRSGPVPSSEEEVSLLGLPCDVSTIIFLMTSNGGSEISSVTVWCEQRP